VTIATCHWSGVPSFGLGKSHTAGGVENFGNLTSNSNLPYISNWNFNVKRGIGFTEEKALQAKFLGNLA
jgi:hypothetical protein